MDEALKKRQSEPAAAEMARHGQAGDTDARIVVGGWV
jgi:hypothetical protein